MTARQRRTLVEDAYRMVRSRTFITINGIRPFGVKGELFDALEMVNALAGEVEKMQAGLQAIEEQK